MLRGLRCNALLGILLAFKALLVYVTERIVKAPAHFLRIRHNSLAPPLKYLLQFILDYELYGFLVHTFHTVIERLINVSVGIGKFNPCLNVESHQVGQRGFAPTYLLVVRYGFPGNR